MILTFCIIKDGWYRIPPGYGMELVGIEGGEEFTQEKRNKIVRKSDCVKGEQYIVSVARRNNYDYVEIIEHEIIGGTHYFSPMWKWETGESFPIEKALNKIQTVKQIPDVEIKFTAGAEIPESVLKTMEP